MSTIAPPTTLNFVAIPSDVAQRARETLRDDFGHALTVTRTIAPCRHCLRIPNHPEEMILLSYRVLPDAGPYAEIGPIFVHADACERYANSDTFPEDFLPRRLILRAYDHDGTIADAIVSAPGNAERDAVTLLAKPSIAEVHVRHVSYTCFDFKILHAPLTTAS
jgi:Protein of unknown function (DUF1203)